METLEQRVVRELAARSLVLVTAESCTGGLLAKRITDVPGASAVFHGGFVTYSNEMKTALLGVPFDLLATHGAVSEPVARAMAEGARSAVAEAARNAVPEAATSADHVLGIALTGIAGPGGGTLEKPVGLIYIGFATAVATIVCVIQPEVECLVAHSRDWHRQHASDKALELVLANLPKYNQAE